MTLEVQFFTMITMIACGFYLGAMYDTFMRFSPLWKGRAFLNYFLEIIFWLTQTAIIFFCLYKVNEGEVRLYAFLAGLLGFSMYQALAKNLYHRLLEFIIRVITIIYQLISNLVHNIVIKPAVWIFTTVIAILLWLIQTAGKIIFFIIRLLLLPIKWLGTAIYHLFPKSLQNYLHQIAGFYSKIKNIVMRGVKKIWRR